MNPAFLFRAPRWLHSAPCTNDSAPSTGHRAPKLLKAVSLVLLTLLFAQPACVAPGAPKGKILIEFWDYPRLPEVTAILQEQIAEFMRQNPEVHVEYTKLSWAKGGERVDIAAFAGRPPDMAGAVLGLKYVEAGLLEPLDKYLDEPMPDQPDKTWREDIHPEILQKMTWEGKVWGMPWYKEGFIILLNRDILAERGVAPPESGRWTWDEFLAAMRQLTFDRDGDGKIDVYGIGFSTGKEKWEAYSFLFAEGMEILSEDGRRMIIDSEATRRGINRLLEMEFEHKISLPGAGGIMDDVTWSAFSGPERRLAGTCQALWSINAVKLMNQRREEMLAANPNAANVPPPLEIEVALYPEMPGQPQIMASYGVGCYMVFRRPTDPRRTEAAARLARFLTLSEASQRANRAAGLLPSRISMMDTLEGLPEFENVLPYMPSAVSPPTHPVWLAIDQVIGEQLQLALLRRITVDEAVRAMSERGQMVLDDYWESKDAGK